VAAINHTRIDLARRRRGLTKTKLAESAGVSARILTDYLSGGKKPSEATLAALASVLEMPVEFFSGDDIEEPMIDGVSFRALSSMTARQRGQAIGAAAIALQLDDWIRARFKLPVPDVPHLRNLPADDPEQSVSHAETIAESLRNRWGLGERRAPNMVHLLEAHGVRVYSLAQESADVDAFSFCGATFRTCSSTTTRLRSAAGWTQPTSSGTWACTPTAARVDGSPSTKPRHSAPPS
jgi:transcriptional regulator with XRE-family HTH domain